MDQLPDGKVVKKLDRLMKIVTDRAVTMPVLLLSYSAHTDLLAMEMVAVEIMRNEEVRSFLGELPGHAKHQALVHYISARLVSKLKEKCPIQRPIDKATDYFTKSELKTVRTLVDTFDPNVYRYHPRNKRLIRVIRHFPGNMYFVIVEYKVPLGFGVVLTNDNSHPEVVHEAVYRLNGGTGEVLYPARSKSKD